MDPFHGLIPDSDVCVGFTNPTFSWSASLLESEHHVGWLQTVGLGDMFNVLGPLDDDTATTLFELDSPAESHTTSSSESIKPPSSRPPHTGRVASGAAGHVLPRQLPHPQSWSHDPVTVIPYSGPREKSHRIRRLRPARRANALVDDKVCSQSCRGSLTSESPTDELDLRRTPLPKSSATRRAECRVLSVSSAPSNAFAPASTRMKRLLRQ